MNRTRFSLVTLSTSEKCWVAQIAMRLVRAPLNAYSAVMRSVHEWSWVKRGRAASQTRTMTVFKQLPTTAPGPDSYDTSFREPWLPLSRHPDATALVRHDHARLPSLAPLRVVSCRALMGCDAMLSSGATAIPRIASSPPCPCPTCPLLQSTVLGLSRDHHYRLCRFRCLRQRQQRIV